MADVADDLSDELAEEGVRCRGLFDSERPNFPSYLNWVATLQGEGDTDKFMTAFSRTRSD